MPWFHSWAEEVSPEYHNGLGDSVASCHSGLMHHLQSLSSQGFGKEHLLAVWKMGLLQLADQYPVVVQDISYCYFTNFRNLKDSVTCAYPTFPPSVHPSVDLCQVGVILF